MSSWELYLCYYFRGQWREGERGKESCGTMTTNENTRGNKSIKTMEEKCLLFAMVFNEWRKIYLKRQLLYNFPSVFLFFPHHLLIVIIIHLLEFPKKKKWNTTQWSKRRRKNIFFNCVYLTRRKLINSDDFFFLWTNYLLIKVWRIK